MRDPIAKNACPSLAAGASENIYIGLASSPDRYANIW